MESLFLFAPGAGASSSHPWMRRWARLLETIGVVRLLDYNYVRQGSRRPDPLLTLIAAHRDALSEARKSWDGPIYLVGKSMGSRIGCHLSLEENVAGLICLGYPLCGGGDPAKLRDKVLRELTTPILFVQGTRDPLCPLDLLGEVRTAMKAENQLLVIKGGDHSLLVTKTQLKLDGETPDHVEARILRAIEGFVVRYR